MPVKFNPDPLRFAGVIREKLILSKYIIMLSCIYHAHAMTAYSESLFGSANFCALLFQT